MRRRPTHLPWLNVSIAGHENSGVQLGCYGRFSGRGNFEVNGGTRGRFYRRQGIVESRPSYTLIFEDRYPYRRGGASCNSPP